MIEPLNPSEALDLIRRFSEQQLRSEDWDDIQFFPVKVAKLARRALGMPDLDGYGNLGWDDYDLRRLEEDEVDAEDP